MSGGMPKSPRSLDEQVDILTGRGLEVGDREYAKAVLLDGNYYRLSGYLRQFQTDPRGGDNSFPAGTTLHDVLAARDVDAEFSELLLAGLLQIERVIRSRFAYYSATRLGASGYYVDASGYLPSMPGLDGHLARVKDQLCRVRTPMIARYAVGDDLTGVPIWVAVEHLPFGTVSRMMEYVVDKRAAKDVADSLGLPWEGFTSTVHSLAVLRNGCAHHAQLWHRRPAVQSPFPRKLRPQWPADVDMQGVIPSVAAALRFLRAIDGQCARATALEAFIRQASPLMNGYYNPRPR